MMTAELGRIDNFGAGPGALPLPVLLKAQDELLNFSNTGMSVMEVSHRNARFEEVQANAEQRLRQLLGIGEEYAVLFLQGGASLQFSMVPMNFLHGGKTAGYILSGSWSEKALKEAQLVGQAVVCGSTKDGNYVRIPLHDEISVDGVDAYLHLTSNNTIYGTQWKEFPNFRGIPLVADMSSDILSRSIDVNRFSLIYAGAQKNLGPSGITVVIVRKTWMAAANEAIPTMLRYGIHAKNHSRYNTPPTFAIYMLGLVMEWVQDQGGVEKIERQNVEKARLIYDVIDTSPEFFDGHAEKQSRSIMNLTFRLPSEQLTSQFLQEAQEAGFVGLAGHRSVGGCRASLYNAVSVESCTRLAQFMHEFRCKH